MLVIHMDAEIARAVGRQLSSSASQLYEYTQVLSQAWGRLQEAWEGSSRDHFSSKISPLLQTLRDLSEELDKLGWCVLREADEWEQIDRAGVQAIGRLAADLRQTDLTGLINPEMIVLAIAAGGGGTITAWLAAQPTHARDLFVDLLRRLGVLQPTSDLSAVPPSPPPTSVSQVAMSRTTFGDLLKMEAFSPSASGPPYPPDSGPLTPAETLARNALNVPLYGQERLGGAAACNPTSMSMIMNYWDQQGKTNGALSPAQIYQEAKKLGYFAEGSGMGFDKSEMLFERHGYDAELRSLHAQDSTPQQTLQTLVKEQPVMTMLHLNLKSDTITSSDADAIHAVVIAGTSADGSLVRINDPWESGRTLDLSWDRFWSSWESINDDKAWDNTVLVVKPAR